ncbi:MAG: hypothetical protein C4B58_14625 [Deltaproteobacteria bacterium]|nr:MAG: hypothetical protein C4B58_14625 [Deltaproteobacteria bacterium]
MRVSALAQWPVQGEQILLATFTFTCIGLSLDEIWLWDLGPCQWVTLEGYCLDDELAAGIYLASIFTGYDPCKCDMSHDGNATWRIG